MAAAKARQCLGSASVMLLSQGGPRPASDKGKVELQVPPCSSTAGGVHKASSPSEQGTQPSKATLSPSALGLCPLQPFLPPHPPTLLSPAELLGEDVL